VAILRFLSRSPHLCRFRTGRFCPDGKPWFILATCQVFLGPGKPSSPITTLSNCHSLLQGGLLEGEWGSPEWRLGRRLLGAKTSSREQRPDFNLVGTHRWLSYVRPRGAPVRRVGQVLPLRGVYQFEYLWYSQIWVTACPLLSSHSMFGVLLVVRGWGLLWLCYHYYYINLPLTLTWVNILLVYAYSSL
jgi:hypothetical protein